MTSKKSSKHTVESASAPTPPRKVRYTIAQFTDMLAVDSAPAPTTAPGVLHSLATEMQRNHMVDSATDKVPIDATPAPEPLPNVGDTGGKHGDAAGIETLAAATRVEVGDLTRHLVARQALLLEIPALEPPPVNPAPAHEPGYSRGVPVLADHEPLAFVSRFARATATRRRALHPRTEALRGCCGPSDTREPPPHISSSPGMDPASALSPPWARGTTPWLPRPRGRFARRTRSKTARPRPQPTPTRRFGLKPRPKPKDTQHPGLGPRHQERPGHHGGSSRDRAKRHPPLRGGGALEPVT